MRFEVGERDELEVIAGAGDLFTAMRHANGRSPRVLLPDLEMPDGPRIGVIRRLRTQVPETEVVVLTMDDSPTSPQHPIDAGALGQVSKDPRRR